MRFGSDAFGSTFDGLAATYTEKIVDFDGILANDVRVYFQFDALLKGIGHAPYQMSGRIGVPSPYYMMDAILVLDSSDPKYNESFVNAFFWTYENQHRQIDEEIQLMQDRLKIEFASSSDLDEYWGPVLGVSRRTNESTESYRTRLATHIRVITSSGTAPNIQAVIDRIIGVLGGSQIENFYPASFRLNWTSPYVAQIAKPFNSVITETLNKTVAAGVTWSTSYPFQTYEMDFLKCYTMFASYEMDGAMGKKRGASYYMMTEFWESGSQSYDMDQGYRFAPKTISYDMEGRIIQIPSVSYSIDGLLDVLNERHSSLNDVIDGLIAVTRRRSYAMDGIIEEE